MKILFNRILPYFLGFLVGCAFLFTLLTSTYAIESPTVTLLNDTVQRGPYWSKQVRILRYQISGVGTGVGSSTAIDMVTGVILAFKFDTIGVDAPDDFWDLSFTDSTGADIFQTAGVNMPQLDTAVDSRRIPVDLINGLPIFVFNDSVILNVANFSAENSPIVDLYIYILLP